jgi:hypothetical protein
MGSAVGYIRAMNRFVFLGACLVALTSQPAMAQTGKADVVVVRVYDGNSGKLVIARAGGKTEEVLFNGSYSRKGLAESTSQFQQTVASLYEQGYALKSTFSSGASAASVATLVFVKEK